MKSPSAVPSISYSNQYIEHIREHNNLLYLTPEWQKGTYDQSGTKGDKSIQNEI